jgi:hypothetical protein
MRSRNCEIMGVGTENCVLGKVGRDAVGCVHEVGGEDEEREGEEGLRCDEEVRGIDLLGCGRRCEDWIEGLGVDSETVLLWRDCGG